MIQKDEKLVCWRKLLSSEELDECDEEIPLYCPNCQNILEIQ
ncbi:MAG: hypothetical protein BAJALOKI1v1_2010008 [Promethearchaeota archaeon]|nr:MAG: hypothetical protein BAJALOKI1v1_2010008 [Candidatus Lokiarchaeota archaeon]